VKKVSNEFMDEPKFEIVRDKETKQLFLLGFHQNHSHQVLLEKHKELEIMFDIIVEAINCCRGE